MEQHSEMFYCVNTTESHTFHRSYPHCYERMKDVAEEGGCKTSPFTNEKCLNLDKLEIELARKEGRSLRSTMDIAFGVSIFDAKAGTIKKRTLVLCDYKLRVRSPRNLGKKELDSKISGSKAILGQSLPICQSNYFVFTNDKKEEAYNHLRRLYSNKKTAIALTITELAELYF